MGFNSAFKGIMTERMVKNEPDRVWKKAVVNGKNIKILKGSGPPD